MITLFINLKKKKKEKEKSENEVTLKMATKKQSVMIKELKNQLKVEANKNAQLRAEIYHMKDELDELRSWREQYLLQETKGQLQYFHDGGSGSGESDHGTPLPVDVSANTSSTQEDNMSTDSGKHSSTTGHDSLSATKQKKNKLVTTESIRHSYHHHPQQQQQQHVEHVGDSEYTQSESKTHEFEKGELADKNKEHEEVIFSLSERLAVVKEENMILKHRLTNKNNVIEELQRDLDKKQEWILDLIEKLNDKPTLTPVASNPVISTSASALLQSSSSVPSSTSGHDHPTKAVLTSSTPNAAALSKDLLSASSPNLIHNKSPVPKHKPVPKTRPPKTPMLSTHSSMHNVGHRDHSHPRNTSKSATGPDTDSDPEELGDVEKKEEKEHFDFQLVKFLICFFGCV
ncbi:spore germination protein GerHA [Reticulomyxa filosa]|uniref:Spore germination protein GerHA n=1 Tax=Reticulomyxa filosa TaxID=46433 RepID=X6P9V4_RETFI|nr:spore germination protein GerHA [Reticulomyxa filosa]|eukprot:ETO34412.1 spore germination protein GerHA [Reticulomyxa filosa]